MDKESCEENKGGGNEAESKSTEINNVTLDLCQLVNQRLCSALCSTGLSQLQILCHGHCKQDPSPEVLGTTSFSQNSFL